MQITLWENDKLDFSIHLYLNLDSWALPFQVRWFSYTALDNTKQRDFYVEFLCFRMGFEYWK